MPFLSFKFHRFFVFFFILRRVSAGQAPPVAPHLPLFLPGPRGSPGCLSVYSRSLHPPSYTSSFFTVPRIYFLVQIRGCFMKFNTFLISSVLLNHVRIVTNISYFFLSLFVYLKSDDNSRVSVRVIEFRCYFHCIDLICT